ncbi:piggyBac transposable element-derived protein 3-like [Pieris napi]|uniref:piggyBac transposable element-derived protein 3-like n=1 Tax=Pieris napi TaxID=78633 RepID=UPI001FBA5F65|nr:piggyBac transposable element-derived protein 3-like [Pieris napi]
MIQGQIMVSDTEEEPSDSTGRTKRRRTYAWRKRDLAKNLKIEEHYSVDEAMIPYYGRHGCKQHIKGKPIRYGFKAWVGATRLGYVLWMEPYQGAKTMCNPIYKELGLGASVVLTFCDVLISRGFDLPYHVVFDNFFTGTPLLEEITKKGLRCTGTVRENRTSSCPLITSKLLKKKERGAVDYRTTHDNTFIIAKWHDNNIFSIASNAVGINPKQSAKRFSQSEKRNIVIEEPHIVSIYNKYMGGVDRSDENISHYRIGIRGKKWYMPLLTHMIDLAEHNAWQLYKINHGKLDHLGFRRRVAIALIESNRKNAKRGPSRPSHHEHADSRKDQMNHLVIPQSKQTRCRQCHKKCLTRCKKCDVGVCVKCFETYHS